MEESPQNEVKALWGWLAREQEDGEFNELELPCSLRSHSEWQAPEGALVLQDLFPPVSLKTASFLSSVRALIRQQVIEVGSVLAEQVPTYSYRNN